MSINFTFGQFIINEDRAYLGHCVGDVLTAAHDLQDDIDSLGARQIARMSDNIVNQIRKILHRQWEPYHHKNLVELQAIAVMIKKAIDEKKEKGSTFDLKETIKMAIQKLEDVSSKLGTPVNKADAPPADAGQKLNGNDFQLTGTGPQKPQSNSDDEEPESDNKIPDDEEENNF
jgi:hypothetical protein